MSKRETLIFCRVEKGFMPTGRLRMILGSEYYIDFSGEYFFEEVEWKLLKSLQHLWHKKLPDTLQRIRQW